MHTFTLPGQLKSFDSTELAKLNESTNKWYQLVELLCGYSKGPALVPDKLSGKMSSKDGFKVSAYSGESDEDLGVSHSRHDSSEGEQECDSESSSSTGEGILIDNEIMK